MVVEVRAGRETFPTHLALVGFLAGMDAPMGVQRAGRAEALAADETHVRFFTCRMRELPRLVCFNIWKFETRNDRIER